MASHTPAHQRNEAEYPQDTSTSTSTSTGTNSNPIIRRSRPTRRSRINHDDQVPTEMNVDTNTNTDTVWPNLPSTMRVTHRRTIGLSQSQSLYQSQNQNQSLSDQQDLLHLRKLHREIYGKFNNHVTVYSAMTSNLKPWRWWKGASKDVVCFAWSADTTKFAAGAVASEEFNRGNNLLLGDITRNTIEELPCHYLPRDGGGGGGGGGSLGLGGSGSGSGNDNSFWITDDLDSRCFATVTKARWIGNRLFTASLDKTVKIWDIRESDASDSDSNEYGYGYGYGYTKRRVVHSLNHEAGVTVMDHPRYQPNLLATGTVSEGVYLWNLDVDVDLEGNTQSPTNSPTAVLLPIECGKRCLTSTALSWGQTFDTRNILVGGMEESNIPPNGTNYGAGHLQVWNIEESSISIHKLTSPHSQYIFDIKFHPSRNQFATASTSFRMALPRSSSSRSVIQIYDINRKPIVINRFLCPALDVNEVTFCPRGDYITASCTDGNTYVWDERNSSKLLHKLSHGAPLNTPYYYGNGIAEESRMEQIDFGVGVAVWGAGVDQFFTGSSDGILMRWDVRRSVDDVCLGPQVESFHHGLTNGLFSDDGSLLLIGDAGGGIHVLSSGPVSDPRPAEMTYVHGSRSRSRFGSGLRSGPDSRSSSRFKAHAEPSSKSLGLSYADELLRSNQLTMHPIYGPVQGPNYSGPFAGWARGLDSWKSSSSSNRICGNAPLLERVQLRQFDGPPVSDRWGLSRDAKDDLQRYFNTAEARAQHIKYLRDSKTRHSGTFDRRIDKDKASRMKGKASTKSKSKRRAFLSLDLDSRKRISLSKHKGKGNENEKKHDGKRKVIKPIITRVDQGVIDLTGDLKSDFEVIDLTNDDSLPTDKSLLNPGVNDVVCEPEKASCETRTLYLDPSLTRIWENLEEDYWWPDSRYLDANLNQLFPVIE